MFSDDAQRQGSLAIPDTRPSDIPQSPGPELLSHVASEPRRRNGEQGSAVQMLLVVVAAIAVAALAVGSYLYFSDKPVTPTGSVEQTWVYPIHRESTVGGGGAGMVGVKQDFDQLMLLARVKIVNPGKIPIYVRDISATVSMKGQDAVSSAAAGRGDFDRVFVAYPEMAAQKQTPLTRDTTVAPGASAQGLLVFSFPLTKQQWDAHSAVDVTVSFIHQPDLVLKAGL